jgi:hypothetical protein
LFQGIEISESDMKEYGVIDEPGNDVIQVGDNLSHKAWFKGAVISYCAENHISYINKIFISILETI